MDSYVMGLDLGTSSCHCLLVSREGRPSPSVAAPIAYRVPEGGPPLAREFDPEEVMAALGSLVPQALDRAGVGGHQVMALGITSQRQGAVVLDGAGGERYCGPNIDLRAVLEGAALDQEMGSQIYCTTGHWPSLLFAPARLRWLQQHRPELRLSQATLLSVAGWLAYRLTGQTRGELGLECELGLVDVSARRRAGPLLERLGLPATLLPAPVAAAQPVGGLTGAMARRWGMREGTPVALAGADVHCALMGLGLGQIGSVAAVLGWSGSVMSLTAGPLLDRAHRRTWASCYPVDGLYVAESNLGDAGNAYRWLVQTLGGGGLGFREAEQQAAQTHPGSEGVCVFLGPAPVSAPRAGLRMGGILLPTPLSFQEATPGQLFRAYLESLAYSVRSNLPAVAGPVLHSLHLGGGLSRSDVLAQTLADVLESPVRRSSQPQVSALGAACAAWVVAGRFRCLEEGVAAQRPGFQTFLPDPHRSAQYWDCYRTWRQLYDAVSLQGEQRPTPTDGMPGPLFPSTHPGEVAAGPDGSHTGPLPL